MEKLRGLLSAYGMTIWLARTRALAALIDQKGKLMEWNPAFEKLRASLLPADSLGMLLAHESRASFDQLRLSAMEAGLPLQGHLTFWSEAVGAGAEYDCSLIPVPDGQLIFLAELVEVRQGVAENENDPPREPVQLRLENALLKQKLADKQVEIDAVVMQAKEVAHTDDLTLLPNRRQIVGDLQREVMHSDRYSSRLSISMLDVDRFKMVNDTFGHATGDLVLRNVARYLREHIREPDIVGRYGGEEFLVLLPDSALEAAIEQAGRLCHHLRTTPMVVDGQELHITVSIGVAEYRPGREDWQKLLSRADSAMYQAKARGRDGWAAAE
jgi:diguanylate cyclase (GGDEF)-like protein